MLVLPADPLWQADAPPPASIQEFQDDVAGKLGAAWDVTLTAYDNDSPADPAGVSVSLRACHGDLVVSVTRHAGSDSVLIGLRGAEPSIPFEDIAVAKHHIGEDEVLARAHRDPDECPPLVTLDKALWLLGEWCDDLPVELANHEFAGSLNRIAAKFADKLFGSRPSA